MQLNFNASTVAPSTAPEPVETGTYAVLIAGAREVPTKDKQNTFLELKLEVKTGPAMGRVIIDRLNLNHNNPQTREIAYGQLSAICHVTGRMQLQNSQQLIGAMMQVYVVKEPRNDAPGQYGNAVKGYKDMNGNEPGQGGQHGGAGQMAMQGQANNFDPNAGQASFAQNAGQGQVQQGGWDANAGQMQGQVQQGGNMQGQNFNQQGGNVQQGGYQQQPDPQMQGGYQQSGGGQNFNAQQQFNPNQQGGYQQQPNAQQMQQNNGYQQQNAQPQMQGGYQQNTGVGGPAGGGQAPDWA